MAKRKTNEQFVEELKLKFKNVIPDEPYINAITPIQCHCNICGYSWPAVPNSLLSSANGLQEMAGGYHWEYVDE